MSLEVEVMTVRNRLWEAVLDAFQLPESQLDLAMHNPDPVKRMHFIKDLILDRLSSRLKRMFPGHP